MMPELGSLVDLSRSLPLPPDDIGGVAELLAIPMPPAEAPDIDPLAPLPIPLDTAVIPPPLLLNGIAAPPDPPGASDAVSNLTGEVLPVTSTSLTFSMSCQYSAAYRTRTGNRCRPSMVIVALLPPSAVSTASEMSLMFTP